MLFIDQLMTPWGQPMILIARLNIESSQVSRIVFDWPSSSDNNVFKSHFTFDQQGRLCLLKVEIGTYKVSFQSTTVRGGFVEFEMLR